MNRIDCKISVVVPVYNSEKTILTLLDELKKTLSQFKDYEIILINDFSTDNSFSVIREYTKNNHKIIAVDLKKNVGQQKATFLGLKYAKGEYIIVVDDDLAHAPDDILHLYDKIQQGYDVVYGIQKNGLKKSFIRNFGSKVRDFTFDSITKKPKDIKVSSFRIINKKTNDKIITANTDYIYISMEILKHTTNIANIYVNYAKGTTTNYSLIKLINLIVNMYVYYSDQKIFKTKPLSKDTYKIGEIVKGEHQ